MQHRPLAKPATPVTQNRTHASVVTSEPIQNFKPSSSQTEELARIFNTAVVSSKARAKRDFSSELFALTDSSAFKTILNAVQQLARIQGIPEKQAAEQVIQTFRRMDELWGEYMFHEGLEHLKNNQGSR